MDDGPASSSDIRNVNNILLERVGPGSFRITALTLP